jgi:hypothetical protein
MLLFPRPGDLEKPQLVSAIAHLRSSPTWKQR